MSPPVLIAGANARYSSSVKPLTDRGSNGKNHMSTVISYQRPDGASVNGYLAEGAHGTHAPGIVVIQEWWGLNDQIRGVADKLAGAGYRALVPDLYRGKVALDSNEAEH